MIRIRQSYLEAFRRAVDTPYGSEEELIRAIRGEPEEPRWQMAAGTAWHAALADPDREAKPDERVSYGGYSFLAGAVYEAQRILGPGLWEVPGRIVRPVMLGQRTVDVSLECTADHLRGLVISDNKTKFSPVDPGDYEDSLQWRVYLLVHGCDVFRYCLWSFADPKDGYCDLEGVYTFRLWRYPHMEADVTWWLARFLAWAADHQLLRDLQRDPYKVAA